MADLTVRARSVSEIVDGAFVIYRRNAVQLISLAAVAVIPHLLAQLLLPGARPTTPGEFPDPLSFLLVNVIGFGTYAVMAGLLIHAGSRAYLGETVDAAQTLREVLPRIPQLLIAQIIRMFFLFVGVLMFFIGVFYFTARLFALESVIVIERGDPLEAVTRSGELSKGQKGHILSTMILVGIVYTILVVGATIVAGIIGSDVITLVITSAGSVVGYPLYAMVLMLLYYDTRIRNEGYDVERMAAALDAPAKPIA